MVFSETKSKIVQLLDEETSAPERPSNPETDKYLRSYLRLRIMVGLMGVALPIVLLLGDAFLRADIHPQRSSLSAYYHSGMRDAYVSVLLATGVVLLTYKVADRSLSNFATSVAGLSVMVVAIFPTGLPVECGAEAPAPMPGCPTLTGLQEHLGEAELASIHRWASIVFIVLMCFMSWIFATQEGKRGKGPNGHESQDQRFPPVFWKGFHRACAVAILAVVVFNAFSDVLGFWRGWALTFTESVCALAFGLSWCAKGLEEPYVKLRRRRPLPMARSAR